MLGIAGGLGVPVRDVVVDPDEAAAELPLDARDGALEDLTDLGCLRMAERPPDERSALGYGAGTISLRNRCLELIKHGVTTFDEFARLRL